MGISRLVAFRYLHASRENRYFSWITILSVLGMSIGVAALIVVLSVFNGFEYEVRSRLLASNAHIVASVYPAGLVAPDKWMRYLQKDRDFGKQILGLSPFIQTETMAKQDNAMQGVMVRGIDPRQLEAVQNSRNLVFPPTALDEIQDEVDRAREDVPVEVPRIVIGDGLAEKLGVKTGTLLYLIDPTSQGLTTTKPFKVIGLYRSGLKQYDERLIVMSLPAAQKLAGMGKKVTGLAIALKDADQSASIAAKIQSKYSQLSVREWQSMNRYFFEMMHSERTRVGLIVALVALVAGFNILTTVFVSVSQRQKDISILKALGARNRQIMRIFLLQSSLIGFLGSGIGVIMALIIAYVFTNYPFLKLPDPYFLTVLPVRPTVPLAASISSAAILICWFAGLYPAFIASRVAPTEGLVRNA